MGLITNILSQTSTVIFAKDLAHRIVFCNEKFAELAGESSPNACHGKTDEDFAWKKYASIYREGDSKVYRGASLLNHLEPQNKGDQVTTILLNKQPLLNEKNQISGLIASYFDVTELKISKIKSFQENHLDLGEYFNHTLLTPREYQVLKQILLGHSAKRIALNLSISPKTVETHISHIKIKMQCKTQGDIISNAVYAGLYNRFFHEYHA